MDEKTLVYRKPTHKFSSTPEKSPSQDDGPAEEAAPDINASNQTLGSNENNSFQNSLTQWWQRRKQFADDNPRTIQVRNQAIMYLAAFVLTHFFSTANRILQEMRNGQTVYVVVFLHALLDPLQGFTNFLVYQRPRFVQIRKRGASRWSATKQVLEFSCWTQE